MQPPGLTNVEAKELFDRCAQGDADAWGEFLKRYRPLLQSLARRRLGDDSIRRGEDVEETVGEMLAFLCRDGYAKLLAYNPAYRPATWLGLLAGTVLRERLRREGRLPIPVDPNAPLWDALQGEDTGPAGIAQREESLRQLQEALTTLAPRERLALRFTYEENLSSREVAQALGIPEGTLTSLLSRTREKLRERLKGMDG